MQKPTRNTTPSKAEPDRFCISRHPDLYARNHGSSLDKESSGDTADSVSTANGATSPETLQFSPTRDDVSEDIRIPSKYRLIAGQRMYSGHKSMRLCGTGVRKDLEFAEVKLNNGNASYSGLTFCGNPFCFNCCLTKQREVERTALQVIRHKSVKGSWFITLTIPKEGSVKNKLRILNDIFRRWFRSIERVGKQLISPDFKMSYLRAMDLTCNPYEQSSYTTHLHIHSVVIASHHWDWAEIGKEKWQKFASKLNIAVSLKAQDVQEIDRSAIDEFKVSNYLFKNLAAELIRSDTKVSKSLNTFGVGRLMALALSGCIQSQKLYFDITRDLKGAKTTQRGGWWLELQSVPEIEDIDECTEEDEDESPTNKFIIGKNFITALTLTFGTQGEYYPLKLYELLASDPEVWQTEFNEFKNLVNTNVFDRVECELLLYDHFAQFGGYLTRRVGDR